MGLDKRETANNSFHDQIWYDDVILALHDIQHS